MKQKATNIIICPNSNELPYESSPGQNILALSKKLRKLRKKMRRRKRKERKRPRSIRGRMLTERQKRRKKNPGNIKQNLKANNWVDEKKDYNSFDILYTMTSKKYLKRLLL